jgi:hypothetical protein
MALGSWLWLLALGSWLLALALALTLIGLSVYSALGSFLTSTAPLALALNLVIL